MSDNQLALSAEDVLSGVGYVEFVRSLFNRSHHRAQDYTHAILGIATETRELLYAVDDVNGLEEEGDLDFYEQALINLVEEFTGEPFPHDYIEDALDDLIVAGDEVGPQTAIDHSHTEILDVAKRWIGYGKEPKNLELEAVKAVAFSRYVRATATYGGHDRGPTVLANVRKLLKRYNGMKFNADLAVNRDVDAERRGLESDAAAA